MQQQFDLKEGEQDVLDSKDQIMGSHQSTSVSPISSEGKGIVGKDHLKSSFASVTPEKSSSETSHVKCLNKAELLPQEYRILLDFLDRMVSSSRLLALCKKPPTFHNISRQVEILTGRKFEYKHLAQINYLLPEAVKIDKILVHNVDTLCMNPDIKITLTFDIVEGCHEESVFTTLRNLLASRLRTFLNKHSKACDIPEAVLPDTFNQRDATISSDPVPVDVSTLTRTATVKSSHFSPSYTLHFVERAVGDVLDKTRLIAVPFPSSASLISEDIAHERISSDTCAKPTLSGNSVNSPPHDNYSTSGSTPLKFVSESDNLMLETPAQSTPKRSSSTCEGKLKTLITQAGMPCNQTAKRSLDFSLLDDKENALNLIPFETEQIKILPSSSTQMEMKRMESSINSCEDAIIICHSEKGNEISQCCLPEYQQGSFCLSELAISIQKIFQSVNRRSMTKEELVHKIIMNNCDIDEKGKIEEQIDLLEKRVPGWICKKLVPSGDLLYSIEKVQDLNSVLGRATVT